MKGRFNPSERPFSYWHMSLTINGLGPTWQGHERSLKRMDRSVTPWFFKRPNWTITPWVLPLSNHRPMEWGGNSRRRKLKLMNLLGWTWWLEQNPSKVSGPFRDTRWTNSFKRTDRSIIDQWWTGPLWTIPLWTNLGWTDQKAMCHSTNNYVVSKEDRKSVV